MKRFVKIFLPVLVMLIIFSAIYFITRPQPKLPDSQAVHSALLVLQDYGFESRQIVGSSDYIHLAFCSLGFAIAVSLYFYLYDASEKKKILRTVDYVRHINQRIYDLKPDEESEAELSLLTNELYKTTVLLRETAEINKKRAGDLETALADISHQLRTPLTSLQLMLDNIYEHPDLDLATRQDFLRTAGQQVEQMSELVVTLLRLAKLDNGTLKMQPKVTVISDLLNDVVSRLNILAELNSVNIKISGALNAKLKVDPKWQTEALTNIVKNCIEHSKPHQTVEIKVQETAVFTKITISDNGDGISPEDTRHIFERFYKAGNARSESVGIGLAFAKTVIAADAGQIRVKSKVGEGTKFIINYYTKR